MIRRLTVSAALVGLLAACGGSQSTGTAVETEQPVMATASVRVVHASHAAGVSFTIDDMAVTGVGAQGDISGTMEIQAGSHWFTVTSSGGDQMLHERVTFPEGTTSTVFVVGDSSSMSTVVAEDELPSALPGSGFGRFINAARGTGPLNFTADGRGYAAGVAFGDVSQWYQMAAGGFRFEATGGAEASMGVNVAEGGVYTFIVVDRGDGLEMLVITE